MCCDFLYKFVYIFSQFKKNKVRYDHKGTSVLMYSIRNSFQTLTFWYWSFTFKF
jgi:hypothetical protein